MYTARRLLLLLLSVVLTIGALGCATGSAISRPQPLPDRVYRYYLYFDERGNFSSQWVIDDFHDDLSTALTPAQEALRERLAEASRLASAFSGTPRIPLEAGLPTSRSPKIDPEFIDRIDVVSLGWNYTLSEASETYDRYLAQLYAGEVPEGRQRVVIGIVWESASTASKRLFSDTLPLSHRVLDVLSMPGDGVLFPISYWAKTNLADEIGNQALRTALERMLEPLYGKGRKNPASPPIYLVGHSFGTRLLNGLVIGNDQYACAFPIPLPSKHAFKYRDRIGGALFLASPKAMYNVVTNPPFPVVYSVNGRDYALRKLFPLGTTVRSSNFTPLAEHGSSRRTCPEGLMSEADWKILLLMPTGYVRAPLSYLCTQAQMLFSRNWKYPFDTMAALPIVEFIPRGLNAVFDSDLGNEARGLLDYGEWSSAVGTHGYHLHGMLRGHKEFRRSVESGLTSGVHFVDMTELFGKAGWADWMPDWLYDLSMLSTLDPKGSHSDFEKEAVVSYCRELLGSFHAKKQGAP